jgi:hypothetical protein
VLQYYKKLHDIDGDAGGVLVLTAWFGFRRLTSFVSGESALKVFMVNNHATRQPGKSGFQKHFAWRSGGDIPAMRSCLISQIKRLSSRRPTINSPSPHDSSLAGAGDCPSPIGWERD